MLTRAIYLVPIDFTPVTENAMNIAIDLAKRHDGLLYLLHVVKRDSEKKAAETKFRKLVASLDSSISDRVITKVMAGNLYEEVGRAGDILNAVMTVMGTHGAQGVQRIFGSNALKMISKSPTPFLVSQDKSRLESIETIVMPFSFVKESIQVLRYVRNVAKEFEAVVHLVGFHDEDDWLKSHTQANLKIVRNSLSEAGVPCEIVNLPRKDKYEKELLDYMLSVKADLIAATYFKTGILPPPNSFVQIMIENDHNIPILTVNADELGVLGSVMTI